MEEMSSPAEMLKGDDDLNQTITDVHMRVAQVFRLLKFLYIVGLIAFSLYVLIAWDIKLDTSGQSLTDSTYAACRDALPASVPHADRICTTFIAWYEADAILWVLVLLVLHVIWIIPLSFDIAATRLYAVNMPSSPSVWEKYKHYVGINASVNTIEEDGVHPMMHPARVFIMISFWVLAAALSTNHNVSSLILTVSGAIAYSLFGYIAAINAAHTRPMFHFVIPWFGQFVALALQLIAIGYFNTRVYVEGADHYVSVVWVSGLIFLVVMVCDLFWDFVMIAVRNAVMSHSSSETNVRAKNNRGYFMVDDDEEEAAIESSVRVVRVVPTLPFAVLANWSREFLFETGYGLLVIGSFVYFMCNGISQVI